MTSTVAHCVWLPDARVRRISPWGGPVAKPMQLICTGM